MKQLNEQQLSAIISQLTPEYDFYNQLKFPLYEMGFIPHTQNYNNALRQIECALSNKKPL